MLHRHSAFLLLTATALGASGCTAPAPPTRSDAGAATLSAPATTHDQLLLATIRVGLPPDSITPADLPEPNSRGAHLETQYCTQCHALPSPMMHGAADWPGVVRRMWLRVERLAPDQHVESAAIGDRVELLKYLGDHALQVSGAMLPQGRGREEFSTLCSRCHALPDPHTHGPQDWSAVVLRMERNMERMNVRPLSQEEIRLILEYLQGPGTNS